MPTNQALHLTAIAQAFDQQRGSSQHAELPFEDASACWSTPNGPRASGGAPQRLRHVKLRHPPCLEDVDFTTPAGSRATWS